MVAHLLGSEIRVACEVDEKWLHRAFEDPVEKSSTFRLNNGITRTKRGKTPHSRQVLPGTQGTLLDESR